MKQPETEHADIIGATLAVYALHPQGAGVVDRTIQALRAADVSIETGPMTTMITGAVDQVFQALRSAYDVASATGATVMTITVSNACPLSASRDAPSASDCSGEESRGQR